MEKMMMINVVNQKGILVLVAVWAFAAYAGSPIALAMATLASVTAYLSDWMNLWGKFKCAWLFTIFCFMLVVSSIILSIMKVI